MSRMNLLELKKTLNEIKDDKALETMAVSHCLATDCGEAEFGLVWHEDPDPSCEKIAASKQGRRLFDRFIGPLNKDLKLLETCKAKNDYEVDPSPDW